MGAIEKFEDLKVWQLGRQLTANIYSAARMADFARDYGFRDQICRASVSITSNIAEGFERKSNKAFQSFLAIAKGSAGEVRSQLYAALDIGYIDDDKFHQLSAQATEIGKMLSGLIGYLETKSSRQLSTFKLSTCN